MTLIDSLAVSVGGLWQLWTDMFVKYRGLGRNLTHGVYVCVCVCVCVCARAHAQGGVGRMIDAMTSFLRSPINSGCAHG